MSGSFLSRALKGAVLFLTPSNFEIFCREIGNVEVPVPGTSKWFEVAMKSGKLLVKRWDRDIEPRQEGFFNEWRAIPEWEKELDLKPMVFNFSDWERPRWYSPEIWEIKEDCGIDNIYFRVPKLMKIIERHGVKPCHSDMVVLNKDGWRLCHFHEGVNTLNLAGAEIVFQHYRNQNTGSESRSVFAKDRNTLLRHAESVRRFFSENEEGR